MWGEEPKSGGWGEPPITSPSWGTKPKTPTGGPVGPGWGETDMELQGWGHQNKVRHTSMCRIELALQQVKAEAPALSAPL